MNIIAHGQERLRDALEQRIRAEVRQEFGERLSVFEFKREVNKRLKKQMPSSATVY
jgi:hypothetical protein